MCEHTHFDFDAKVVKHNDGHMLEMSVKCTECGVPFQFLGLEEGVSVSGPRVTIDGLEALMAIAPANMHASPYVKLVHGVHKLSS